jgi:hypothetical protein
MLGYQGGESSETVARKIGYRSDAKRQWNCLTSLTCRRSRPKSG